MPRALAPLLAKAAFLLLAPLAGAAIFPDQIGTFQKGPPKTIAVPDQALYDEFGLEATEQAEYTAPSPDKKRFNATAWRLHDPTGALALFEARRPPAAAPSPLTKLAVRTSDGVIFAYGNYVFQFTGSVPAAGDLQALYNQLPKLDQSPLPALMADLPPQGLEPNSERYIIGPVSLQRFYPGIPPSVAAFHTGAEAQIGKYKTAKGLMTVAIFNYPTPSMARDQAGEFQKLSGAVVKRTGPLVAVTFSPPDPDAAERVLARINYQVNLTVNEKVPVNEVKGMANILLNIFALAGIMVCLCVVAGIGFGGFRVLARKMGRKQEPDAMIVLDLNAPAHK